ncbi:MAG: type II secretion system secretin GspD [bacterium]|nr:type II secretion system secretin GspD [bacterium]
MRERKLPLVYCWTGRVLLPVFTFVQVFAAGPSWAQGDGGLTVTGAPVASTSVGTNANVGEVRISGTNVLTAAGTVTPTEPELITLNLEAADLKTVLLYLAEITGETILPASTVRGEVTIINPKPVTREQAKQIIYSILESMNFTVVKYDHLVKVIPSGDAKSRPIKTLQPPEDVSKMDTEDIIRAQVIYPKHILAKDVETFITPLLTPGSGKVIINEPTGAVIIIDTGPNIKRLMEIIDLIDRVIEGGQVDIEIIPLQHADEKDMATLLGNVFSAPALRAPTSQRVTLSGAAQVPGAPTGPGAAGAPARPGAPGVTARMELDLTKVKSDVAFLPESRSRSLIVISARYYMPLIKSLIARLDVPSSEKDDVVHIYPLQHAKADEISATLAEIFAVRGEGAGGAGVRRPITQPGREEERGRLERMRGPEVYRPGLGGMMTREGVSRSQPPTTARSGAQLVGNTMTHLSGKVDVLYDLPSNSLIIICAATIYDVVKRIIQKLDQRVPQVWIEAVIVEVSRNKDFNLGVGWKDMFYEGHKDNSVSLIKMLDTSLAPALDEKTGRIQPGAQPGIAYAYGVRDKYGNFDPYFTLQTAEGVTDINVLSTPSILASNNKEALISVGKTVPYLNYSRGDTAVIRDYSYSFLEISIQLSVIPMINKYGEVAMDTQVDVLEDGGPSNPDDPSAPPITLQRSARTTVVVQDGQTLVIGGLIKDDFKTTINKVPILGDIPIIKHAFRTKKDMKAKQELLIFITPHVVQDYAEGNMLTEGVRKRYRGASAFVTSRDRAMLYDDMNIEQRSTTIYDDWREFEKHIERAESYLMVREEEYATNVVVTGPYIPAEYREQRKPYEGRLIEEEEPMTTPVPAPTEEKPPSDQVPAGAERPSVSLPAIIARERALVEAVR